MIDKYQYLLSKIAYLEAKQLKFIRNVFEHVFQDSLSSQLARVPNRMPYEIWVDIKSAFTTVTFNKSAKAIGDFHKLRRTSESLRG